jgi:hypothetical protein
MLNVARMKRQEVCVRIGSSLRDLGNGRRGAPSVRLWLLQG